MTDYQGEYTVTRYHDICMGHRVFGHESKCAYLHGHNYRFHFTCRVMQGLDDVGRVVDFSVMKDSLCMWLEDNWDHRMLLYKADPFVMRLQPHSEFGVVVVPFNPTAENIAAHLVEVVGPEVLKDTGVELIAVDLEETAKCSAHYTKGLIEVDY